MKRVIVPTDFSDNAYNALVYAVKLLQHESCTFFLVNTYTPTIYQPEYLIHSPGQIGLGDVYQQNSETQLEETKAKIEKEHPNAKHTFEIHSAFNMLAQEIEYMVLSEGADLVVMGTQGATGAQEVFLGTNTVHVLKKVDCPVIAIPSGFAFRAPKKVLFPTDYEISFRKKPMQLLLDIAGQYGSQVNILHVVSGNGLSEGQLGNRKALEALLAPMDKTTHEFPDQTVIAAINGFQQEQGMDLLVMVQNKHTFFERLFIEPVIKKMGFHTTVPFMVMPYWE
jgi:nucleotide-binding universal stress UspA family protein